MCKRKAGVAICPPGFFCFLLLSLAICGSTGLTFSQQKAISVRSVSMAGTKSLKRAHLEEVMQTTEGRLFARQALADDLERIVRRYAAEGYPFARIDSVHLNPSPTGDAVDVLIVINEGKPAVVKSLKFEGARGVPVTELVGNMILREGDLLLPPQLESDIKRMLELYERSGYPFAAISVGEIEFEEGEREMYASVRLDIQEGKVARLTELRVEGNETTKTFVILREARLKEGELFRGDQPERIRRRLERLQLFSSVSNPELFVKEDGSVGLLVRVAEGNANRFDGILGYVPSIRNGEDGYLTGLLDVQFRNILGTGRQLATRWHRESQSSQEIELKYREPWLASYPLNVDGTLFQRKQDSMYVHRRYHLHADLMLTEELSIGILISQATVIPSEGTRFVSESQSTSVGVSVSYDTRDDAVTPSDGMRYKTEYYTGTKKVDTPGDASTSEKNSTQRLSFDLEYFISPISRQVLAASIFVRDYRTADIEISDLFRLGGANTLRGYREAQFLGSRIAWSNLEYRVIVAPRSYAYAFVDAGYVLTPDRPSIGLSTNESAKIGYGVGVRLDSPLGLIGVSLAMGEGDSFSTAKLHFRLINEF